MQRFENFRVHIDYDVCSHRQYRPDPDDRTSFSEEMIPHVEVNGELILGGIDMTPAQHLCDWLNRTLKLKQVVVHIIQQTPTSSYYDILVENH
jgi:hypothetical protein